MRIPLYQLDAFTDRPFSGNPAAVCLLPSWPQDSLLQNIALENNLSETAFLVRSGKGYELRWFTPTVEVDLCGHATLASARVVFDFLEPGADRVFFSSVSGPLTVSRQGDRLCMDFPARPPRACEPPKVLAQALQAEYDRVLCSNRDLMVIFQTEQQVRELSPDQALLGSLDFFAVMVTAPGDASDFVSRFFAPRQGIPEDPVTGSAHCTLVPYWSKRLGRKKLHARQVSSRGGELWCEDQGERVSISGQAVLVLSGEITI